ncbi:metallophosphoesterase [Effusibacillus consociatus]|uniref:Metallophosphoesterase n=1 Tax=Effusibacillus consociatus TaxID=1117041 RepID=A0ABV9Q475_9BACL
MDTTGLTQLALTLGTAAVVGTGIYASVIERFWLNLTHVRIVLPRLPRAFGGFKIALFSDVHLGFFYSPQHLSTVVDLINRESPDVICFTGDFLDSRKSLRSLEPAIPVLERLNAPYGKFALLGNHDYRAGADPVIRGLERGGFRVLRNEHSAIRKQNEQVFLIGLDDVLEGKPNLEKAMEDLPPTACKILLAHEPDYADTARQYPIDLQISGHSHGGQIRFPFVGPIYTTKLGRKYLSGLKKTGNLLVYTNRGIGTTCLPIRFLCRPEITMITLEPKP